MGATNGTRQPSRVIVGHCPDCQRVCVVENEYGVWPLVVCECGWRGATDQVDNYTRHDRGGAFTVAQ